MPRIKESIFLKLLLVFVLAAAANVAVMRYFQRNVVNNDTRRLHRLENLLMYSRFLADSLGEAPEQQKLQALSDRLHLKIRVEGPGLVALSSPSVPTFNEVNTHIAKRIADSDSQIGRFRDWLAIETRTGQTRYLFLLESENALEAHSELLLGLLLVLLTILLLTYLSIRGILSPIRALETGVQQVSQGNLDAGLPAIKRRDELGRLIQSFNHMTEQVRNMIHSKEQLLLDVSHEFRTPLTRIKLALELGGDEGKNSIRNAVKELEAMISELLESARLSDAQGRLKLEKVDLSLLIGDLVSDYERESPGVRFDPPASAVEARIDPSRINTALKNILENAMKYSSNQKKPVEVQLTQPDSRTVRVTIRDFGIGIPKEEQSKIFEPFYRVDRSRVKSTGGYGLGLALCKKIILAHRGSIQVQSTPGQDTLFFIDLPA